MRMETRQCASTKRAGGGRAIGLPSTPRLVLLVEQQGDLAEAIIPVERLAIMSCTCHAMRDVISRACTPERVLMGRSLPSMAAEAEAWTTNRVDRRVLARLLSGIKLRRISTTTLEKHVSGKSHTYAPASCKTSDFTAECLHVDFTVPSYKHGDKEAVESSIKFTCHWIDFPNEGASSSPCQRLWWLDPNQTSVSNLQSPP